MNHREKSMSYWLGRLVALEAKEDLAAAREAVMTKSLSTTEGPRPKDLGLKSAEQIDEGSGQALGGAVDLVIGGLRFSAGVMGVSAAIGRGLLKDGAQMIRNSAEGKPLLDSMSRSRRRNKERPYS